MKKGMEVTGAVLAWSAVILQFVLILANRQASVAETIARFFSFFTILTNTLVALFFTLRATGTRTFLGRPGAVTAVTAFILLVGIVYQAVLRGIWTPTGLQWLVDELLHTLIPLYVLAYFYGFSTAADHRFRPVWPWLLYPAVYFVLIILRGGVSDFYPYPFVNASVLGYGQVALNFGGLAVGALLLIGILIGTGHYLRRPRLPAGE